MRSLACYRSGKKSQAGSCGRAEQAVQDPHAALLGELHGAIPCNDHTHLFVVSDGWQSRETAPNSIRMAVIRLQASAYVTLLDLRVSAPRIAPLPPYEHALRAEVGYFMAMAFRKQFPTKNRY